MASFDRTPDKPESLGYKVSWFAVKAADPARVVDALELGAAMPANWESGLAAAYPYKVSQRSDPWVFVSPPVSGWVLAVSCWFPYPSAVEAHHQIGKKFDVLFSRLMARFDEVQFFGSDRVSDFVAWARAVAGKPTRVFAYANGEVLVNLGDQTVEEARLGLVNLTGLSPADAGHEMFRTAEERNAEEDGRGAFPDENDVVELAALWSIDPTQLSDQDHPPGLGLAARLPKDLMQ